MVRGKTPVKAAQERFTSQVKSSPAGLRGAITAANRAGQGQMSVETQKMTKAPTMTKAPIMTKAPQADLDRKAASETTPKSSTVIETPVQPSVDPFAGLTGGARQAEIERQAGLTPTMAPEPEVEQPLTLQAERTQPAQLEAPSLSAQRQALQERLLASMTPDAEEQALQDELAQLRGSVAMGVAGEEGQGRLRTQNIVRGRQAIQQRQGALQEQTLLDRLAAKQAQRQAELGRLQTELGIITAEEQAQAQAEQAMAEQLKPFEFAGNLVQFDPATGELVTIAEAPAEAVTPITLSEGQSLVNPLTGEVVFTSPKTTDPLQEQEQMLRIQKLQQELNTDVQTGILNQEQLGNLQQTPEFKALNTVDAFYSQLQNYKNLVEQFGRAGALQPNQRQQLASAYADLGTSWKELKNLGALTGPDLELLEQAIPDATSVGFLGLGNVGGVAGTGGRILNTLENTERNVALDAIKQYNRLVLRDPRYGQSDYLNTYVMPFVQSDAVSADDVAQAINYPLSEVQQAREAGYDEDTLKAFILSPSFNNDLSRSQNGSPNLLKLGQVTGYGSPLWQHGLDIDLKKGDPVPAPVSGTVEFVGEKGGFGNQVRIKDANGNSHWLSHLDSASVRPGQQITAGEIVGKGGNTGRTIPGKGGDGSHLDYTVMGANGQYIPPRQIAQFLNQIG